MSNIETELKYLLSKDDFKSLYRHLKSNCKFLSITRQVNYYFDAPNNPLQNKLLNIRIRFIRDKSEMTLKVPIIEASTNTIQNSYEYNIPLNRLDALKYINQGISADKLKILFKDAFENHTLKPMDLVCYGHLRTVRISFSVTDNLPPLLLDINHYLGIFDYELEWELKQVQKANKLLQNVFDELGIHSTGNLIPKVRRFFNRFVNIKKD